MTDEVSQDVRAAAAFASAHGLSGLEIRSVNGRNPFELTDGDVRAIRAAAEEFALSVCAIAPPFYKCDLGDARAIDAHLDGLRRCAEIANALGAKIVRGFAFWRAEGAREIPHARIAEEIARAIPILEDGGILLAIENDPSVYTPDGRTLSEVVRAVGHPRVGAVWDPGNCLFDPGAEESYPGGYRAVRGKMVHMHMKDARRTGAGAEAVPFGLGAVDYRGQFSALTEDRYDGWVSLETHYRRARALDEEALRLPAGFDFSEGGASASAEFLKNMAEKLNEWGMGALYSRGRTNE